VRGGDVSQLFDHLSAIAWDSFEWAKKPYWPITSNMKTCIGEAGACGFGPVWRLELSSHAG
jgi:hypothetical protein